MSDHSGSEENQPGWASPGDPPGGVPTDPWGNPMPEAPTPSPAEQQGDWWGEPPPVDPAMGPAPMGPAPTAEPFGPPRTEPKAIWGLVLSIVGLLVCGVILQPIAIVLGFLSRKSIRESYGQLKGDGLAIAAIVIGIIGFVLSVIVMIAVLSDPDFMDQVNNGS